ncbi:MAG: hypothetical protein KatS3mg131_2229 [Candidatus Tectimicrobiota bacterium]|nr:MAG: hypothetical protein KatS3mg131_2229 [Candidatus Tectomicrobia bacterium]
MTLITGALGSGKTTLLRHLIATVPEGLAILMNEFGEVAIDSRVIEGKNVRLAELGGGCVCCSLLGEFEAAVEEILATVAPQRLVVETTGVAEPDALIFSVQESLPQVRLDGVVTVADADALVRFPALGHTERLQLEAADLIVLNKTDLVSAAQLADVEARLRRVNEVAALVRTQYGRVDPDLLFGLGRTRRVAPPQHVHQPEFASCLYESTAPLGRACFEEVIARLDPAAVVRAKGFVCLEGETYLFNYVCGRWDLEPFAAEATTLVFIGPRGRLPEAQLVADLKGCEQPCPSPSSTTSP